MVDSIDLRIKQAAQRLKQAKNPIEAEDAQTQLDNLLDIRLATVMDKRKELTSGN